MATARGGGLAWAVALWTVLAFLFVFLAIFAAFYDRFPADERIAHALQGVDLPALGGLFDFTNKLGDALFYIPLLLLLAVAFAASRAWLEAFLLLLVLMPGALNSALKDLIGRPRPSADLPRVTEHESDFSFPSGHVVSITALFGLLFLLLPAVVPWRPLRWLLQAGCLLLVLAVGPARVYIGVHWPSDVLGGYLLALLFLLPAAMLYRAIRPAKAAFEAADGQAQSGA